ncbi:MAG: single-stranded DNA-binding protein, partial [Bacteroidales bacterium]|nr:single-stranded DNA-binding protein [Bacteroidales bacterium]
EQTEWHTIVCWKNLAELCEKYVRKGSRLYIEGRIRTNSWIDKTTQEKRSSIEIFTDNILFLDRAGDDSKKGGESNISDNRSKIEEIINKMSENTAGNQEIEDLPF